MRTLAFFFESEFALFVIVFVLSSTPVFTSLFGSRLLVSCSGKGGCYLISEENHLGDFRRGSGGVAGVGKPL